MMLFIIALVNVVWLHFMFFLQKLLWNVLTGRSPSCCREKRELDDKNYEYRNPKAWIKQERIETSNTSPFTCIQFLKLIRYKQFGNTVNYLLIFSILVLFSFSIFASSISNTSTFNEILDFALHCTYQF